MNNARLPLALALLVCTAGTQAQSLAVRVDNPDWSQVQFVQPLGDEGTTWTEQCFAAGVKDHSDGRYIDGHGHDLPPGASRAAWLKSITAEDLSGGRLGSVVRVDHNAASAHPQQVFLRADREGDLERDLACVIQASPVGDVVGYEIGVVSGGRQFKWQQPVGSVLPQVGAWMRTPAAAVMSGYAPRHTPPNPPRGDWADEYYIGYPYAERYSAPVVNDAH